MMLLLLNSTCALPKFAHCVYDLIGHIACMQSTLTCGIYCVLESLQASVIDGLLVYTGTCLGTAILHRHVMEPKMPNCQQGIASTLHLKQQCSCFMQHETHNITKQRIATGDLAKGLIQAPPQGA